MKDYLEKRESLSNLRRKKHQLSAVHSKESIQSRDLREDDEGDEIDGLQSSRRHLDESSIHKGVRKARRNSFSEMSQLKKNTSIKLAPEVGLPNVPGGTKSGIFQRKQTIKS